MIRIVIAAVLIYLLWHFWKKAGARKEGDAKGQRISSGEMIACDRCGTYILKGEAISNRNGTFCSEGCLKGN